MIRRLLSLIAVLALALAAFLTGGRSAAAASMRVTSIAQLEAAIAQAQPGDTITVADGQYSSGAIAVGRAGTADARITITAESIGGAVISGGAFRLTETAAYVTIRGFRFNGAPLVMDLGSRNCLITRNHFEVGGASRAVHIQGNDQEVSFNNFQNKTGAGAMVSIDASGRNHAGTQRPYLHHNLFLNHGFTGGNGGECIATWGQVTRVEHNLFEQCNGDPEIISVKASDGFYRFNTFRGSTRGQLVLRFARKVVIEGNFLIGTRGMRLYGPDHKIINNHFENNNGTAMAISHGASDGTYLRVERMLIAHNTIINDAITGRSGDLPPQGVTFANNIIHKPSGPAFTEGTGWTDTRYEGNIVSGGATAGDLGPGARIADARLSRDPNGLHHLTPGSPAIDTAVGDHGLTDDIEGQPRIAPADVGADELSTAPVLRRPLTRADVGPMAPAAAPSPPGPDGGTMAPPDGGTGPSRDAAAGEGSNAGDGGGPEPGSGGGAGTGGASGSAGAGPGTGGTAGGGSAGSSGTAGIGGDAPRTPPRADSGCGCRIGGAGGGNGPASAMVALAMLVAALARARSRGGRRRRPDSASATRAHLE